MLEMTSDGRYDSLRSMSRKRRQPTLARERRLLVLAGVSGTLLLAFLVYLSV